MEGWVLLDEALRSGIEPEAVFVVPAERGNLETRALDVPCFEISPSAMAAISALDSPPGVLGVVGVPFGPESGGLADLVLVLVDVSDPGNVGTLIRSAEAAGFDRVALLGSSVDLSSPKVIRAAAGSTFRVRCDRMHDLDELRSRKFTVLGLTSSPSGTSDERAVESLYDVPLVTPLAIAVGSEAHGLPSDFPVDRWVTIPHHGPTESLNAAMAGTVACMHVGHRLAGNESRRPTTQD